MGSWTAEAETTSTSVELTERYFSGDTITFRVASKNSAGTSGFATAFFNVE